MDFTGNEIQTNKFLVALNNFCQFVWKFAIMRDLQQLPYMAIAAKSAG